MSYHIDCNDGQAFPVITCDLCSKMILYGESGNALWIAPARPADASYECEIFHTHKKCNHAFEASRPPKRGELWMSHGLNHHLWMLAQNCGYSAKKGRAQEDLLVDLHVVVKSEI